MTRRVAGSRGLHTALARDGAFSRRSSFAAAIAGLLLSPASAPAVTWEPEVRLTADTTTCETGLNRGALAVDSWGRVTVAWAEQDGPRGNFRIRTRARDTSGTWMPDELAVDYPESYAGNGLGAKFPALAVVPGDSLLLVWHDYRVAGIANCELFTKVRAPGEPWGNAAAELRLTTSQNPDSAADNSYVPNVAVDPSGTAHAAWYDYRHDPSRAEILFKSRAGGAWDVTPGDAPDANVSANGGDSVFPALAAGPDGSLHLAWRDNVDGGYRIYYAYRPASGSWTGALPLSPPGAAADGVALAAAPDGTVIAAWSDARDGAKAVYVRERTPGGTWSGPRRASPAGVGAEEPALAVDASGRRHLVWQDARVSILNREIFHQAIDAGATWDSTGAADSAVSAGVGKSSRPTVRTDGAGRVFVVWQDARHGATEMYFREAADGVTAAPEPAAAVALQAFPNPFVDGVRVTGFPVSTRGAVLLDARGRLLARLAVDGNDMRWNGRDAAGRDVPPGVYFVRPEGPGVVPLRLVRVP